MSIHCLILWKDWASRSQFRGESTGGDGSSQERQTRVLLAKAHGEHRKFPEQAAGHRELEVTL